MLNGFWVKPKNALYISPMQAGNFWHLNTAAPGVKPTGAAQSLNEPLSLGWSRSGRSRRSGRLVSSLLFFFFFWGAPLFFPGVERRGACPPPGGGLPSRGAEAQQPAGNPYPPFLP